MGSRGSATRFAGYSSKRHYDLRGQRVSVLFSGSLNDQVVASQICYLALREGEGQIFWETSPDGTQWTTMCSTDDPASVANAIFLLWVSADPAVSNPGVARFDDFNLR